MQILSPINFFLEKQGFLVLDGGLATELEGRGHDLNHHLWSARLLDSDPGAIAEVQRIYLEAGADCITTASYQGSIPGFLKAGYSKKEAVSLLKKSVKISCEVRDEFVAAMNAQNRDRISPLVAASLGPFGAYLADGSEYSGRYKISAEQLYDFHEERMAILADTSADILACETIPSFREAEMLHNLIVKYPGNFFWVSFSCRNKHHIYDGTSLDRVVSLFSDCPQVVAIGVNCTAPKFILGLIEKLSQVSGEKEMIVYPNSGESYDKKTKKWTGESDPSEFSTRAEKWFESGVRIIGGCCRTGPAHIRQLRSSLQKCIKGMGG